MSLSFNVSQSFKNDAELTEKLETITTLVILLLLMKNPKVPEAFYRNPVADPKSGGGALRFFFAEKIHFFRRQVAPVTGRVVGPP